MQWLDHRDGELIAFDLDGFPIVGIAQSVSLVVARIPESERGAALLLIVNEFGHVLGFTDRSEFAPAGPVLAGDADEHDLPHERTDRPHLRADAGGKSPFERGQAFLHDLPSGEDRYAPVELDVDD